LLSFHVHDLDDIMHLSIPNCFYLIKYFFGKRFFISKSFIKFKLGTYYNNFLLQTVIRDSLLYFIITFLTNDILSVLNTESFSIDSKYTFFSIVVKDMSFFSEKKNNVGFFNLKDPLNTKFYINLGLPKNSVRNCFYSFFKI